MSRMAVTLTMLAAFGSEGAAQAPVAAPGNVTAEQALAKYRATFRPPPEVICPKDPDPEAITVCGRRRAVDPNRLPLPVKREPGERIRGEAAVMGPDCIRLCHHPVQVDLIKAVPAVVEGIKKILDPDR